MISKEKVMIMTKAAMEESRTRSRRYPASRYFPEDYVGFQVLKGIIGVTFLFLLVVGGWALSTADTWMTWSFTRLWEILIQLFIIYIAIILAAAVILLLVYSLRYYQSKQRMKEEEYQLKKLCRYYDKEEWGE